MCIRDRTPLCRDCLNICWHDRGGRGVTSVGLWPNLASRGAPLRGAALALLRGVQTSRAAWAGGDWLSEGASLRAIAAFHG
eukprot:12256508-Alexandrium_andersonii.AAC.1